MRSAKKFSDIPVLSQIPCTIITGLNSEGTAGGGFIAFVMKQCTITHKRNAALRKPMIFTIVYVLRLLNCELTK